MATRPPQRSQRRKHVYSEGYKLFLRRLREARTSAGLSQEQAAEQLRQSQTYISRCERGEHRVDVLELRSFCRIYRVGFEEFVHGLEEALRETEGEA